MAEIMRNWKTLYKIKIYMHERLSLATIPLIAAI